MLDADILVISCWLNVEAFIPLVDRDFLILDFLSNRNYQYFNYSKQDVLSPLYISRVLRQPTTNADITVVHTCDSATMFACLVYSIFYALYLVFGAFVFMLLESNGNILFEVEVKNAKLSFLASNPSISGKFVYPNNLRFIIKYHQIVVPTF